MVTSPRRAFGLACLSLLAGAGVAAQGTPTVAARARDVLEKNCAACHSGPRPQSGRNFFAEGGLKDLVVPRAPEKSLLMQMVELGHMPPGTRPKLADADLRTLRDWIDKDALPLPPKVAGDVYVWQQILEDVRGGQKPATTRYVSFYHLLDTPGSDPVLFRDALSLACNLLSWNGPAPVEAIDPTRTIFRVNLDAFGWNTRPYLALDKPVALDPNKVNLYDLILLEYPFGSVPEPGELADAVGRDYLAKAGMLRPVPFVRGDWFVTSVLQPPLYHDLLRLPLKLGPLEEKLAVAAEKPTLRAGVAQSEVLTAGRLVERRATAARVFWRADTLPGSGLPALLAAAKKEKNAGEGGVALFSLANGLPGFYAFDAAGDRSGGLPPERCQASVRAGGTATGLSCAVCHFSGPKSFQDAVSPALRGDADAARLRPLFPGQQALDDAVKEDQRKIFQPALVNILSNPAREPLSPVVKRYREQVSALMQNVEAEKGLEARFSKPRGIGPGERDELAAILLVARLERAVRESTGAAAIVPLDGLTHPQRQRPDDGLKVTLEAVTKGNESATVVYPGDEYFIRVQNKGKEDVWVELIGADNTNNIGPVVEKDGSAVVRLLAGGTLRYPKAQGQFLKVKLTELGTDRYTLFACEDRFPPGVPFRAYTDEETEKKKRETSGQFIGDRYVHPFYTYDAERNRVLPGGPRGGVDPSRIVKISLDVEAKARPR
jgi:serine/threonine-protein kinase